MAFKRIKRSTEAEAAIHSLGRSIHVFKNSACSPAAVSDDAEPDDFYDLTPEDYAEIMYSQKCSTGSACTTAPAASIPTKAVIRVRFPDGRTLEAEFRPSEKLQSLVDLIVKVVARPDLPFCLYTTPPKRVVDASTDFYSSGFIPGAIVYFSYDGGAAAANTGPYLRVDASDQSFEQCDAMVIKRTPRSNTAPVSKPFAAKPTKPRWFKML